MFDLGAGEIVLILIIGLIVIGPKRLPEVAQVTGHWIGKTRAMFTNLKYEINKEVSHLGGALGQELQGHESMYQNHYFDYAGDTAYQRLPQVRTPEDFGITKQSDSFSSQINYQPRYGIQFKSRQQKRRLVMKPVTHTCLRGHIQSKAKINQISRK